MKKTDASAGPQGPRAGLLCLALTMLPVAASGQQENQDKPSVAVTQTIQRFFQSLAARDAQAAVATWLPESPHTKTIRASVPEAILYLAKKPITGLRITRCKIDGKDATAYASFRGKWSRSEEIYTDEPETVWRVQLVSTARGWKIVNAQHHAVELAEKLDTADSSAARLALYRAHPTLAGIRLRMLMENLGDLYRDEGQLGLAKKSFTIAAEIATHQGDEDALCEQLFYLGTMCWPLLSQPNEAIPQFEHALRLARKHGKRDHEILIRNGLGGALGDLGRGPEALAQLHQSLKLSENEDPLQGRSATENLIGFVHTRFGRAEEALSWYSRSLKTAQATRDTEQQLNAYAHLCTVLRDLGDLGQALQSTREGLALCKKHPNAIAEAKLRNTLGLIYRDTGKHRQSVAEFTHAVRSFSENGLGQLASIALSNLGDAYFADQRYPEAKEVYQAALQIAKTLEHEVMAAAAAHLHLGIIHRHQGKLLEAQHHYTQARKFAKENSYTAGEVYALCNLAELEYNKRRYDRALQLFQEAATIARGSGIPATLFQAHVGIGRTLVRRGKPGDLERAVPPLQDALLSVEATRSSLDSQQEKIGFLNRLGDLASDLTEALVRLGRTEKAFFVSEQIKARSIVEILREGRVRVTKTMSPADRQGEAKLQRRIAVLRTKLGRTFLTDAQDQLQAQIKAATNELLAFREGMFRRQPRLQILRARFAPASRSAIQQQLLTANPGTAIVSFLVGNDCVSAFLLRPGKEAARLTAHRIPITRGRLKALTNEFWAACADADPEYRKVSQTLYNSLFKVFQDELKNCTHLVIVPDGSLHTIPFAALVDPAGKHLVERLSISVTPSVTALLETRRQRRTAEPEKRAPVLALGAPQMPTDFADLPFAAREVRRVAKAYGCTPRTGAAATETKVRAAFGEPSRILHLATHGQLNAERPMESFLVFGSDDRHDGFLHAREIVDLDLNADLAILSACETGRGKEMRGEGILGLTWSLLVAGVPAQLVSHWQIHDQGTSELMEEVHRGLGSPNAQRLPTAQALAEAQRRLMTRANRQHPYFWASFYLAGSWN